MGESIKNMKIFEMKSILKMTNKFLLNKKPLDLKEAHFSRKNNGFSNRKKKNTFFETDGEI